MQPNAPLSRSRAGTTEQNEHDADARARLERLIMAVMKIRDLFATLNKDKTVTQAVMYELMPDIELPSGGLEVVGDDGRALFSLKLDGNVLHISAGSVCRQSDGTLLDDRFVISPVAANCVDIIKAPYKP